VRRGIRDKVTDQELLDVILYGITEQGVPSIDPNLISAEKRPLIDRTLSAIAKPTIACMFGSGEPKEADKIPKDGAAPPPLPMDLIP
jgi:hypothetical protein